MNRNFIVTTVPILLLIAWQLVQGPPEPRSADGGKDLYQRNCVACHGADGTRGKWGAKNLQKSSLTAEQLLAIISDGKRIMPAWKKRLPGEQLILVRDYVLLLRKK